MQCVLITASAFEWGRGAVLCIDLQLACRTVLDDRLYCM
jgi:hypothetical protein